MTHHFNILETEITEMITCSLVNICAVLTGDGLPYLKRGLRKEGD
uniref:Uncharacterized protein n=1 Tax=Anguilla anguilla TaxID=7936 RepID=A0A0E9UKG6_ANGAN